MARDERITDDHTGEEITYPLIAVRSIRLEIGPADYIWMGGSEVKYFKDGKSLGEWAGKQFDKLIEEERDSY